MSGGVIKQYDSATVIKVKFTVGEGWYFCFVPVFEGDVAVCKRGEIVEEGVVEKVLLNVTSQSSPVPFNKMQSVEQIKFE